MNPQPKTKPWRSPKYRKWIASLPCCVTGWPAPNDPHHETPVGQGTMGGKCGDDRCVPLAHELHVLLESPGWSRKEFWHRHGKDPEKIIKELNEKWFQLTSKRVGE